MEVMEVGSRNRDTIAMLGRVSQCVAVLLVIAVVAMPVMACVFPDRQLTAEERNCCEKMAHNCESSLMPASHSCCQHPVSRQIANITSTWTPGFGFCLAALVEAHFNLPILATHNVALTFESPPESPLKISSVLRI